MKTYSRVAMTDLKENLFEHPLFMNIDINQQRFPENKKSKNKFLSVLYYDPFKTGKMEFRDDKIVFFDEVDSEIFQAIPSNILNAKVGILHSLVRSAPLIVPTTRFIFLFEISTVHGCIQILNNDLFAIEPVIKWLSKNNILVDDPMNLSKLDSGYDWEKITEQSFMDLAGKTEFEIPYQLTGSNLRF